MLGMFGRVIAGSATAGLLLREAAEKARAASTVQYTANDRGSVAVDARGTNGAGALAATTDSGVAVASTADIGDAISAFTSTGIAVYASSGGAAAVYAYGGEPQEPDTPDRENQVTDGVYAIGGGYPKSAVRARGRSGYAVFATSTGDVACVYAEGRHSTGLEARSAHGYGGVFKGGRAPLWLVPQFSATGFPSSGSHARGELFADTAGNLWYCAAGGSPGRWRKVVLR
jgi:hypothetical protein